MPAISIKPIILKQGKDSSEKATITIRIGFDNNYRYKTVGYKVPVNCWNEKQHLVSEDYKSHKLINSKIVKLVEELENDLGKLQDRKGFDIKAIEKYLGHEKRITTSFSEFVTDYCADQLSRNKKVQGTIDNYAKELKKFHEFMKSKSVDFEEITTEKLKDYERWMIKRKNKPNTIYTSLTKFFGKFFKLAHKNIKGFDLDPLKGYDDPPAPVEANIEYLTADELQLIENELTNMPEVEKLVAVFFLVECYSGIRNVDWGRFTVEKLVDNNALKVRAKKNGEYVYLSLANRPKLTAILDLIKSEGLQWTQTLEHANRVLKLVALRSKIYKRVSSHVGRHTAGVLHAELGYSVEYVAEILGITVKTALIYYKITRQKLKREDELLKGL